MHLLHEICHRGPIYRVLSRFIGERLPYTNVARTAHVRRMRRAVRRESRLITRREALAEAGQCTLKRPSMAGFVHLMHHADSIKD